MENQNESVEQNLPVPKNGWSQKKLVIVGAVVLVGLYVIQSFIFSPERMAERMIESATDGEYDISIDDDGNYSITGENGESIDVSAGGETKIPDNWPNSVPIPSDAKVGYAAVMGNQEEGTASTLNFKTDDSATEVTSFYKDELVSNGWTVEAEIATGDGYMLSATQGENSTVSVYVSTDAGTTDVTVSVQTTN